MNEVYLTRINSDRNMARYYRMSVQPTLFGEWAVVREWGRIGQGGHVLTVPFSSEAEASDTLASIEHIKRRRGYGSTLAERAIVAG